MGKVDPFSSFWFRCFRSAVPRALLVLSAFLLAGVQGFAEPATDTKRILLLHADNQFQPANLIMDEQFRTRLTGEKDLQVELYSEYLEQVRFASPRVTALKISLLKEKYDSLGLDLVIVTDDSSWDFLSKEGSALFPGIPFVFCGITEGKINLSFLRPRTTGNFKKVDILANLVNIRTLQPEVKNVFVVLGVSPQDQYYERLSREAFSIKGLGIQPVFLSGKTLDEIERIASRLSDFSAVLYVSLYKDGAGKTFNPRDALDLIASQSRVPLYGVASTYLGHGIVGGNLLSFEDLSRTASELSLKVLRGRPADSIGPFVSNNINYFDWNEMKRRGLKLENLPAGAVILNRPSDPWVTYRKEILGTLVLFLVETVLVALLIFQLTLRRRVQRALRIEINEKNSAISKLNESEKRFHLLFDSSADAIYLTSLDGHVIRANQTTSDRLKYTSDELTGLTVFDFQAPDALSSAREKLETVVREGKFLLETVHLAKDGVEIPVEINSQIIEFEGEKRILAVARDVTERRKALRNLRENESRYRMLFENSGSAIAISDLSGIVVMCNSMYAKLFNAVPEQLIQKSLLEMAGPHLGAEFQRKIEQVWSGGRSYTEVQERTLPGTHGPRWFQSFWYPLNKESAGLDGIQIVVQDITENRKLSEHLNRIQKMDSIGLLAGGIAHDYNNLLAGLWSYQELAQMDLKSGFIDKALNRLEKSSGVFKRAKSLTSQLLTFSKGGTPIREVQIMGTLISDWAKFAMSGATNPLTLLIAPDLWLCECDAQQISQVVDNLIINARQASPAASPIVVAARNVEKEGQPFIQIGITDEGTGVPPEIADKIFDPFFTTKPKGTGLGLATSSSIAQKHGGWVELNQSLGLSCTFSLYLPAVPGRTAAAKETSEADFDGSGKTALVMDDEDFLRDSMEGILVSLGFNVIHAKDGGAALAACTDFWKRGKPVDLALLDLTIPGNIGGEEVSRQLKGSGQPMISIAMSGYSADLEKVTDVDYGFDGYIAKPFSRQELSRLLSSLL
jgi:PAS domain S-box-containing protein